MGSLKASIESIFKGDDRKKSKQEDADKRSTFNAPSKTTKEESKRVHQNQTIGQTRNKTAEFDQRRNAKRAERDRATRQRLDQLANNIHVTPKTKSSVPQFFKSLSLTDFKTKSNVNIHCLFCGVEFGLLTTKFSCTLCEKLFCGKCIRKITSADITGVVAEGQDLSVCERCQIIVVREENSRKFNEMYEKGLKKYETFIKLYQAMQFYKEEILKLSTKYEYLTESIAATDEQQKKEGFSNVFESAVGMEKDLVNHFRKFQLQLKQFATMRVPPGGSDEKIKKAIEQVMMTFLQDYLPRFRRIRKDLTLIEMKNLNNLYIVASRLSQEDRFNMRFWAHFGILIDDLLRIVERDLVDSVQATGEKWDQHKHHIENFLKSWHTHSAPLIGTANEIDLMHEEIILRKNMSVLSGLEKQFEGKLGDTTLTSRQALRTVIQRLEDSYNRGGDMPPPSKPAKPAVPYFEIDEDDSFEDWHKI
eukprot:TRINITY_DN10876_c0_g1_i1.p1 TRINITY_DN10876_c0_g1~~TRINITY_DN10876_c0_g1_i1.p1  ORF type:complete len:476 (-),score=130.61 TRINITY_DN10876_c0_g1_i1:207-1634(-)